MKPTQTACYALIGSAFVLGALLLVNLQDRFSSSAEASLVITRDRFTLMTAKTRANEEALFVIENSSQKLLVYKTDLPRKALVLAAAPYPVGEEFAKLSGTARPQTGAGRTSR